MGAAADQVVIRARDLVVGFGEQVVLDHMSLDLERGEILGVVGASGSGKSVLLRTIIGLVPRRCGSVEFFAMGPHGPQPQDAHAMTRRWGVLFQQDTSRPAPVQRAEQTIAAFSPAASWSVRIVTLSIPARTGNRPSSPRIRASCPTRRSRIPPRLRPCEKSDGGG
jgi:ATPase subunit of ABC transporter with duplicated ATPase domains